MNTKFKLINRKIYKGIGRPKNSDYNYYKTRNLFICAIIGEPIVPKLPYPKTIEGMI